MTDNDDNKDRFSRDAYRYAGAGFEFAMSVCLFALIGYAADIRWDASPWGTLIGMVVGLVVGMYVIAKVAIATWREEDDSAGPGSRR